MSRRLRSLLIIFIVAAVTAFLLFKVLPPIIADKVYRTAYEDEVERYSEEFSVDPALIYSVIKVESNFNPEAKSDVGAIGLMQIIEDSFDWTAWRLGREDLRFEDMYIPEYSIMFGSYMLSFLYERYGSIELTAAAYHAGMTTVDGWIERGEIDPENVRTEDIKGSNTQHNVLKILKAYKIYSARFRKD